MKVYQKYVGVDIGKFSFFVGFYEQKESYEYDNNKKGILKFCKDFQSELLNSFLVLETTGGYEMELLLHLCSQNIAVHRADTRKVKNFIRSYGNKAKTDRLDAKALASYGHERHNDLNLYEPASEQMLLLYAMAQRRRELKKMLVAEKNRKKGPMAKAIQSSCEALITVLNQHIAEVSLAMDEIINADEQLKAKRKILKAIPGIGDIVSQDILAFMPEIGTITRRQIASLAGLAPKAKDSGNYRGYRRTSHGRDILKPLLFVAAMAARNSNSELKTFYNDLISRGKKKKVALTALMRKILVIANAKIRDYFAAELLKGSKVVES